MSPPSQDAAPAGAPASFAPALSGARALVIGATSGIGAAVVERLARDGAVVTAAGLRPDLAPASLRSAADVVELDVRDTQAVQELVGAHPGLDVLVNAAGVIRRGQEYDLTTFGEVLDVNLLGTMRACVAARPLLAASGGCVVTVASMLSFVGGPLVPAYSASKGAVGQLTKSLAVAWAGEGIRVNAVAPGWIRTDMTAALERDADASARILARTPMRRWGRPEDVAGVVAFLCGPDAAFMTGAIVPVDGGYLAA